MRTLNPYLSFTGNCEEALHFYQQIFGGEVVELHRYTEMPDVPEAYKNKILHAHLVADGVAFMMSDNMPEYGEVKKGNDVTLMLGFESEAEQTKVFEALLEGGKVVMPLEDTFWNARFGSLVDKYGFNWSLNCDKK
jgi:PhnB protein